MRVGKTSQLQQTQKIQYMNRSIFKANAEQRIIELLVFLRAFLSNKKITASIVSTTMVLTSCLVFLVAEWTVKSLGLPTEVHVSRTKYVFYHLIFISSVALCTSSISALFSSVLFDINDYLVVLIDGIVSFKQPVEHLDSKSEILCSEFVYKLKKLEHAITKLQKELTVLNAKQNNSSGIAQQTPTYDQFLPARIPVGSNAISPTERNEIDMEDIHEDY